MMGHIQLSWRYILLCTVYFITILKAVLSGDVHGRFELQLSSFTNDQAVDAQEQCCDGSGLGECSTPCDTFFRICLLNFMRDIPMDQQCTFGSIITPVLGENSFLIPNGPMPEENFYNPLRIDFRFDWPGSFSLVIEAYHDVQHTGPFEGSERTLISRVAIQRFRNVTGGWAIETHTDEHHALDFSYRVICEDNYYGPKCATRCVPRDSFTGHWACGSEGQRVCLDGWTGSYCDNAVCEGGCLHGSCERPGQCTCNPGWEGANCDQCMRYPGCQQGTCQSPGQCQCRPGWGGMLCNQDLNYCINHMPCKNGATCHNQGPNGYTCFCPPGFTGDDCEIREACSCQNGGTCMSTGSGFECLCSDEYTGEFCEFLEPSTPAPTEPSGCSGESMCENGGSCYEIDNGFYCICPFGFSGTFCENRDHCSSLPCQNAGTCFNQVNSFVCVCPSGYIGETCQVNICGDDTCLNGGTCVSDFESLYCECPSGFTGQRCDIVEHDICSDNPCSFGGTCILDGNNQLGYYCLCPEGFTGKNCTTVDPGEGCSHIKPCENGGSCIRDMESESYRDVCLCRSGWEGLFCETPFPTTDGLDDTTRPVPGPSTGGFTDVMQVGIYVAFGVLILLLFVILIIVVCRRHFHHSHNHDRNVDVEKTDSTSIKNNIVTLHKNHFSQEELRKTHQPLLSISEKVCNKQIEIQSENIKKSTCKDYTSSKDYHHDSHQLSSVEKINQECIQYVPQSRHSKHHTDSEEYYYYDDKPSCLRRTDSLQNQCNTPDSSPRHSIKSIAQISAVIEDKPVNRSSQCYSVQLNDNRTSQLQQQTQKPQRLSATEV